MYITTRERKRSLLLTLLIAFNCITKFSTFDEINQ